MKHKNPFLLGTLVVFYLSSSFLAVSKSIKRVETKLYPLGPDTLVFNSEKISTNNGKTVESASERRFSNLTLSNSNENCNDKFGNKSSEKRIYFNGLRGGRNYSKNLTLSIARNVSEVKEKILNNEKTEKSPTMKKMEEVKPKISELRANKTKASNDTRKVLKESETIHMEKEKKLHLKSEANNNTEIYIRTEEKRNNASKKSFLLQEKKASVSNSSKHSGNNSTVEKVLEKSEKTSKSNLADDKAKTVAKIVSLKEERTETLNNDVQRKFIAQKNETLSVKFPNKIVSHETLTTEVPRKVDTLAAEIPKKENEKKLTEITREAIKEKIRILGISSEKSTPSASSPKQTHVYFGDGSPIGLNSMETPEIRRSVDNNLVLSHQQRIIPLEKPEIVKFLRKDSVFSDPQIPKSFLPVVMEKELSPAAKVDYLVRDLIEDYPDIRMPGYEAPTFSQTVLSNFQTKVLNAARIDYHWTPLRPDKERDIFQNVELNRYDNNISNPIQVVTAPREFTRNEFGHLVVNAPVGAGIEMTSTVPTFALKSPDA